MNFVWRKEWIKAYETPWSIFEKLAFANRLERNDILRFFGNDVVKRIKNPNIGDSRRELIQLSGFNAALLNKVFESDLVGDCKQSVATLIEPLNYFRERLDKWFPDHLIWCHDCLSHGYHSWFHQFVLIKSCPIHQTLLRDCCCKCGGRIPFLISDKGLSNPFTCLCGYPLINCFSSEWKTHWGKEVVDIQDPAVKAWLSLTARKNSKSQWLFLPPHMSLCLLTDECQPIVYVHPSSKAKTGIEEGCHSKRLQNQLYLRNKEVFKTVERFIRKKMLKKHRCCIKALQGLLKAEGKHFPPICPYAYAFVFWRTTVFKSKRFFSLPWGDDIEEESGVAAQIISDKLSYLKSRFWYHLNAESRTQIRIEQLYWILDKITVNFCFNFFEQWLQQAEKGVREISVPKWKQICKMVECSFPQIAFKYSVAPNDTLIECYYKPETKEIFNYECPYFTRASKQAVRVMKSYTPQAVAMNVYDNPSEKNKELKRYVDRYVRNLMT